MCFTTLVTCRIEFDFGSNRVAFHTHSVILKYCSRIKYWWLAYLAIECTTNIWIYVMKEESRVHSRNILSFFSSQCFRNTRIRLQTSWTIDFVDQATINFTSISNWGPQATLARNGQATLRTGAALVAANSALPTNSAIIGCSPSVDEEGLHREEYATYCDGIWNQTGFLGCIYSHF